MTSGHLGAPGSQGSDDIRFQFLHAQVSSVTSHLHLADAKAAGVIAFISVVSGYTATKISLVSPSSYGVAQWLGLIGGATGLAALAMAFLAVLPRGWPGRDPKDPFSWVGLSGAAATTPYPDRLSALTVREMQRALADHVETCSLIIRRKYRLVAASILLSLTAAALQASSWIWS